MHTVTVKSAIVRPSLKPQEPHDRLEAPLYVPVDITVTVQPEVVIASGKPLVSPSKITGDFEFLTRFATDAARIADSCRAQWSVPDRGVTVHASTNDGPLILGRNLPELGLAVQMAIYAAKAAETGNLEPTQRLSRALVFGRITPDDDVYASRGTVGVVRRLGKALDPDEIFIGPVASVPTFTPASVHQLAKLVDVQQLFQLSMNRSDAEICAIYNADALMAGYMAGRRLFLLQGDMGTALAAVTRFANSMPPLTSDQALDVREAMSFANIVHDFNATCETPVRIPHHSVSTTNMLDEAQLAIHGVLVMDEVDEFTRGIRDRIPSIAASLGRGCVIGITRSSTTMDPHVWGGSPFKLQTPSTKVPK